MCTYIYKKKKKMHLHKTSSQITNLSDEAHLRLPNVVARVHRRVGGCDDGHEVCLVPRVCHGVPHGVQGERVPFRSVRLLLALSPVSVGRAVVAPTIRSFVRSFISHAKRWLGAAGRWFVQTKSGINNTHERTRTETTGQTLGRVCISTRRRVHPL